MGQLCYKSVYIATCVMVDVTKAPTKQITNV